MKRLFSVALAALALAAAVNPVTWKLTNAPAKAVKPGERFTVKLNASLEPGWHFYSMKQTDEGPVATRIWLAEINPSNWRRRYRAKIPRR